MDGQGTLPANGMEKSLVALVAVEMLFGLGFFRCVLEFFRLCAAEFQAVGFGARFFFSAGLGFAGFGQGDDFCHGQAPVVAGA